MVELIEAHANLCWTPVSIAEIVAGLRKSEDEAIADLFLLLEALPLTTDVGRHRHRRTPDEAGAGRITCTGILVSQGRHVPLQRHEGVRHVVVDAIARRQEGDAVRRGSLVDSLRRRVLAEWTMGRLREYGTGHDDDLRPTMPSHWGEVSAPRERVRLPKTSALVTGWDRTLCQPECHRFEVVGIRTQPTFAFGNPVALPKTLQGGPVGTRTPYDVTPSGKFLV